MFHVQFLLFTKKNDLWNKRHVLAVFFFPPLLLLPAGTGLYSNKPHYHLLFAVSVLTLKHKEMERNVFSCIVFFFLLSNINSSTVWNPINKYIEGGNKTRMDWGRRKNSEPRRASAVLSEEKTRQKKDAGLVATQHMFRGVIKVKDLQFSPGPPNSLAPFQELLGMIYKEADLSAWPPPKKKKKKTSKTSSSSSTTSKIRIIFFFSPPRTTTTTEIDSYFKDKITTSCYLSRAENLHNKKKKIRALCTLRARHKNDEFLLVFLKIK